MSRTAVNSNTENTFSLSKFAKTRVYQAVTIVFAACFYLCQYFSFTK